MKKLLIFIVLISFNLNAQDVPLLEKAHDISRQSKKGYLAQVIPNLPKNTFDMVFIFKRGFKDKIKAEIYTFDQNLNQILLSNLHINVQTIAKTFNVRERTIYEWFDKYESHSFLGLLTYKNEHFQ